MEDFVDGDHIYLFLSDIEDLGLKKHPASPNRKRQGLYIHKNLAVPLFLPREAATS